ncbi:MAG TPA: 3-dehydroquinate synthase, partial [Blastocatellia bacterium]|nr:3-dehydroquinate synthase [Blastocatellia bacterium]
KILNFGHTFAHALERAFNYRYLKHGEAVGYGIRFAAELSKRLELLPPDDVELLNGVVHRLGFLPAINGIDEESVLGSFKFDKKAAGGAVQWVLLNGIGRPVIISGADIPHTALKETFKKIISE